MDSGFMFTYAFGSFITGQLGDRFSPVVVVAGGLLGSTLCLLLIVYGASSSIIQNVAICSSWFLACQLIHGAFQATGGPVNTAIMGNWFSSKGRGLIFGKLSIAFLLIVVLFFN
jgi:OPA family glycerol-3-phosphate transporter-like MFS transporter 1/2